MSDVKGAGLLIGDTARMKRVIADSGYDANHTKAELDPQPQINGF